VLVVGCPSFARQFRICTGPRPGQLVLGPSFRIGVKAPAAGLADLSVRNANAWLPIAAEAAGTGQLEPRTRPGLLR